MRKIVLFLFLLTICFISIAPQEVTTYISKIDLYRDIFKEPYEVLLLVLLDGRIFIITSHETYRVSFASIAYLAEVCKFQWKDVVIAIHSHFGVPYLSSTDKNSWQRMKDLGFRGYFGVYLTSSNKVIFYDMNKNKIVYEKVND